MEALLNLMPLIGGLTIIIVLRIIRIKLRRKSDAWLSDFESKMNNRGFTKRIIAYDFLPKSLRKDTAKWQSVGIWLNYQKQLMALRLDWKATDVIDIPFNKILSVEIIEDEYSRTTGGGVGYGGVVIGGATSKGRSKGLQVRIVTDDITGTQPYSLNFYENSIGSISKFDPEYKAKQECARRIVDECNNIMRHSGQY